MNHFDEHTLELFAMNDEKVRSSRRSIEKHLERCSGCREIVDGFRNLYFELDRELQTKRGMVSLPDRALVRAENGVDIWEKPKFAVINSAGASRSLIRRSVRFFQQRPVAATFASLVVLGALVVVFEVGSRKLLRDTNPAYTTLSESHGALEVYNKHDEMLWQLPHPHISELYEAQQYNCMRLTQISDLDGNGRNDVITIFPLPTETMGSGDLRVFDADKKMIFEKNFRSVDITFRSYHYASDFFYQNLLVDDFATNGQREIFSGLQNGRSPWFLVRLDAKGIPIGRYWHFGQMMTLYEADLQDYGRKRLILGGVDQAGEPTEDQFSVISVLDPLKVLGNAEASATRGFGLVQSNAEIFYIKIPQSDMITALNAQQGGPVLVSSDSEPQLRFVVRSDAGNKCPDFEYVFSREMRILEVKFSTADVVLHQKLKKEGKISSTLDEKYLDNLKNGVEYWDGKTWKKEYTRITQDKSIK